VELGVEVVELVDEIRVVVATFDAEAERIQVL
jgi:hypothetical protein